MKKSALVEALIKSGVQATMAENKDALEAKWIALSAVKKRNNDDDRVSSSSPVPSKSQSSAKRRPLKSEVVEELLDNGYQVSMRMAMDELSPIYDELQAKKARKGRGRDEFPQDKEGISPGSSKKSKVAPRRRQGTPRSARSKALQESAAASSEEDESSEDEMVPSSAKKSKAHPQVNKPAASPPLPGGFENHNDTGSRHVARPSSMTVYGGVVEERETMSARRNLPHMKTLAPISSPEQSEELADDDGQEPLQRSEAAQAPAKTVVVTEGQQPRKDGCRISGIGIVLVGLAFFFALVGFLLLRTTYCGSSLIKRDATPTWLDFRSSCKLCPPHASCLDGSVKCHDGFVVSRHFNTTDFTLETRCDKDPTISKSAKSVAEELVRELRKWRGRCDCGEVSPCSLTASQLQNILFDSVLSARQQLIWEEAQGELRRNALVHLHEDGSFSSVDAILSWRCLLQSQWHLVGLFAILSIASVFAWWKRRANLLAKRETDRLLQRVIASLEDRARGHRAGNLSEFPTPYVVVDYLRDELCATSTAVWPEVVRRIEQNSRVRQALHMGPRAEEVTTWELLQ